MLDNKEGFCVATNFGSCRLVCQAEKVISVWGVRDAEPLRLRPHQQGEPQRQVRIWAASRMRDESMFSTPLTPYPHLSRHNVCLLWMV